MDYSLKQSSFVSRKQMNHACYVKSFRNTTQVMSSLAYIDKSWSYSVMIKLNIHMTFFFFGLISWVVANELFQNMNPLLFRANLPNIKQPSHLSQRLLSSLAAYSFVFSRWAQWICKLQLQRKC